MIYNRSMKNFILLVFVLSHATFAQDMRPESIEKRIMPLGQVCMEGDGCGIRTAGPGYKVAINSGSMSSASNEDQANKGQLSEGNVHTIEMKNEGADGTMVFEPGVIKVSVGDTINFVLNSQEHTNRLLGTTYKILFTLGYSPFDKTSCKSRTYCLSSMETNHSRTMRQPRHTNTLQRVQRTIPYVYT